MPAEHLNERRPEPEAEALARPRRRLGARRRRSAAARESLSHETASTRSPRRASRSAASNPAWRQALLWSLAGLVLALALGLGLRAWMTSGKAAPSASLGAAPSPLTSSTPAAASISPPPVVRPGAGDAAVPSLSVEAILALPHPGREWRLMRVQDQPGVLLIEFPDLLAQGLALNRAAAFIEKKHSAGGQVLGDDEMQRLLARSGDSVSTFYFGHDYSAPQLRRFFERAAAQGLKLNAQERQLQALLQAQGLLAEKPDASAQALVSFTAVQADDPATASDEGVDALRRESTLRHELSHGEFFTDPQYQRRCWAFWREALSEAERSRFRQLLSSMDYDPANEELMVNETQALLMHTPDPRAFQAAHLGWSEAQLHSLRERFRQQR